MQSWISTPYFLLKALRISLMSSSARLTITRVNALLSMVPPLRLVYSICKTRVAEFQQTFYFFPNSNVFHISCSVFLHGWTSNSEANLRAFMMENSSDDLGIVFGCVGDAFHDHSKSIRELRGAYFLE